MKTMASLLSINLFRENQPVIMQVLFKLLVNGRENFKLIALGKHFPWEEESLIAGDFTADGFDERADR